MASFHSLVVFWEGKFLLTFVFQVISEGHKSLITQIFDSESKYLGDDTVFAVKDALTVTFVPRKGDPEAECELQYDMSLPTKKS